MIKRVTISKYRCIEYAVIDFTEPTHLIVGESGSGKSTLMHVFRIMRRICTSPCNSTDLFHHTDLFRRNYTYPIYFKFTLDIDENEYEYDLAISYDDIKEKLIVESENLWVNGILQIHRKYMLSTIVEDDCSKPIEDDKIYLSNLIRLNNIDLSKFKSYFRSMVLISPNPENMSDVIIENTSILYPSCSNFPSWMESMIKQNPNILNHIIDNMKCFLPDIVGIEVVKDSVIYKQGCIFKRTDTEYRIWTSQLSDSEKCLLIYAVIEALKKVENSSSFFIDGYDRYLITSDIQHSILRMRRAFIHGSGGQLVVTSNNIETIRKFSDDNTIVAGKCWKTLSEFPELNHKCRSVDRAIEENSLRNYLTNTI